MGFTEEDAQRSRGPWTEHAQHGGLALRWKRPKAETRLPRGAPCGLGTPA